MADVTFIVHKDWLDSINGLPLEQQDKVIADLVRYGTELEPCHSDDPVVTSIVNLIKSRIDFSKDKYAKKVNAGKTKGVQKRYSDQMIYDLTKQHDNAEDIANVLGCSVSTVNHSEGWRRRKEKDPVFANCE